MATTQSRTILLSTLVGASVRNPAGDDLGTVDDVLLSTAPGGTSFAVVAFGGFLGLGQSLYAVPLQAFGVDTDSNDLVLNIDAERVKTAPEFDKDNWSVFNDETVTNSVRDHYLRS